MLDMRVVVITGGATGIGASCVRAMAARGYHVAINYYDQIQKANKLIDECRNMGVEAIAIPGDVSKDKECRKIVSQTIAYFNQIDALICCAGTTQHTQNDDLDSQNAEHFQRIYSVNVIGMYQMARACGIHLKQSSNGSIVNISSIASQNGSGSSLGYIASKGAVNSLTLALAKLYAPQVRVNAVLPGLVNTDWFRQNVGEQRWCQIKEDYMKGAALNAITEPQEVASAVAFLCVDAIKTTGQLLLIDAGATLGLNVNYSGGIE